MKRFVLPVIWVGLGVAVGVGATLTTERVNAEPQLQNYNPRFVGRMEGLGRVQETNQLGQSRLDSWGALYFIRDTKTGDCWLTGGGSPMALAPAKPESCATE